MRGKCWVCDETSDLNELDMCIGCCGSDDWKIEYINTGDPHHKYTCNDCDMKLVCPYAWDHYNTNGDCLLK